MAQETSTISKMETVQTAVDYLLSQLPNKHELRYQLNQKGIIKKAKEMEKEKTIKDYNMGYNDAQCNHINDAENYANEQEYLNNKEVLEYLIWHNKQKKK